jgi:hypothetical protein
VPVTQETVLSEPFGTLLHFRKAHTGGEPHPPVLLVAPLSGHFATAAGARPHARMLQDHDVYITDWHNARDGAAARGRASPWPTTSSTSSASSRRLGAHAHRGGRLPALRARAGGHGADGASDEHPAQPLQPDPDGRPQWTAA